MDIAAALAPIVGDTAEEGRRIIIAMLLVALVFCSVIAIGNGLRRLRHRGRYH